MLGLTRSGTARMLPEAGSFQRCRVTASRLIEGIGPSAGPRGGIRLAPADDAPFDQFAGPLVAKALGRVAAEKRQQVRADVILAEHLDQGLRGGIGVGREGGETLSAGDHLTS